MVLLGLIFGVPCLYLWFLVFILAVAGLYFQYYSLRLFKCIAGNYLSVK